MTEHLSEIERGAPVARRAVAAIDRGNQLGGGRRLVEACERVERFLTIRVRDVIPRQQRSRRRHGGRDGGEIRGLHAFEHVGEPGRIAGARETRATSAPVPGAALVDSAGPHAV